MNEFHSPRQELVKKVFKRAHRLDIWGAVLLKEIEPPELFTGKDIYDDTLACSEPPYPTRSMVWDEFNELNQLKMIARFSPEQTKEVAYLRLNSKLWSIVEFAIPVIDSIGPNGAQWEL